jgi:hypothetical protein
VDGKRKLARGRRKRAWIITGVILLAYACYAVWDYTWIRRESTSELFNRRYLGTAFGVTQTWVPEGLACLIGETEASKNGIELHFGTGVYIRSDRFPRAHFGWQPSSQVLDKDSLPDEVRAVYEDARSVCAAYMLALPWHIARHPRILKDIGPPAVLMRMAALVSGRCKFYISAEGSVGIARWEQYYEGAKADDGFVINTEDSRLRLYLNEERVTAYYFNFKDRNEIGEDYGNVYDEIALLIRDGDCTAFAEDGYIVNEVFEELQESLPAYRALTELSSISGTAPDDTAWNNLRRGLSMLTTKPQRTHICLNLYSMRAFLANGPYEERNVDIALDNWELPYDEYDYLRGIVIQKRKTDQLPLNLNFRIGDLSVKTSDSDYWADKADIALGRDDYELVLGNPSYIIKVDEYRNPWDGNGALSRVWFVNLENAYPILPPLPQKDETGYGEMKQLADKLAEHEKELGEFGANPMVKRFISDVQNRRVSFRKTESETAYKWEGTISGSKVLWDLRWSRYASPHGLHVSLGSKEFQISGSVRISPCPGGYSQYYNGPLEPLTKEDWDTARALIQAEKIGVVKVPDAAKGGWDKFVQFVEGDKKFVETKLVNIYDRQTDEQLMDLLN